MLSRNVFIQLLSVNVNRLANNVYCMFDISVRFEQKAKEKYHGSLVLCLDRHIYVTHSCENEKKVSFEI